LLFTKNIVLTIEVKDLFRKDLEFRSFVHRSISRHFKCDFGELDEQDKEHNISAVRNGNRILSVYNKNDYKIYIVTEADRSVTTILFPSEY
jgi:hypothetical protein